MTTQPNTTDYDDLIRLLSTIVMNARIQPDHAMDGTTDVYAVPIDDIEAARAAIAKGAS